MLAGENLIHAGLWFCAAVSVATTLGIVAVLLTESLRFFGDVSLVEFFTSSKWSPTFAEKHYGILPLVCGTLLVTATALAVATPIGLGTAIYLSEYAGPRTRGVVKPVLEVLAGIPSVVYGVVAVTTVSPIIKQVFPPDNVFNTSLVFLLSFFFEEVSKSILVAESVFNAASAGIVVGFMVLPMIVSLSEDVLRSVPRSLREGAYALGATRFDVTVKVVCPAALSGIVASVLLAASRAIGETMAVTLAAGGQPKMTLNPLEGVQTMTAYIVQISSGDAPVGSPEYQAIFAVGLTLFASTLLLNILAQMIVNRMREQYE